MKTAIQSQTRHAAVWISEDGAVHVDGLVLTQPEIRSYFAGVQESEREQRFVQAVEVGVACLDRATVIHDVDFIKQHLQEQIRLIMADVQKIPAEIARTLGEQIGTNDGQVLAPMKTLIDTTETILKDKLATVQGLLDKDIDPARKDGKLGRALTAITGMLDPKRQDSIQNTLRMTVKDMVGADGKLVTSVQQAVETALKSSREDIARLTKEIYAREAATGVLATTTAKGATFEQELLTRLQPWAKLTGASVEHVGTDKQAGDILVRIPDAVSGDDEIVLVIEARDDQAARGHKRISDDITAAMKVRKAQVGLYVSKTPAGLAREIGDWAEGHGSQGTFVACTVEHVITAVRFAIVSSKIRALLAKRPEADTAVIQQEVTRIRTALRRIRTIKVKAGDIHKGADAVSQEADSLQRAIGEALDAIEDALSCPSHVAA